MNKLEIEVRTVLVVKYGDLERFVAESYGADWSFLCAEECGNDSERTFEVDGEVDDYDRDILNNWLDSRTGEYPGASVVLNDLAQRRMIEAGEYLIEVAW